MIRFILALIIIVTCGCNKEDPHPELRDPIFRDLKGQVDAHKKEVIEHQKMLGEFQLELQKTEANSIERKDLRIKIAKAQSKIKNHEQWAHFYKIRSERRAVIDRITSKAALGSDTKWPDPAEYSDYLLNKRLREVNLNWGSRVPKLQDRLSKKTMTLETEATAEPDTERKPASGH